MLTRDQIENLIDRHCERLAKQFVNKSGHFKLGVVQSFVSGFIAEYGLEKQFAEYVELRKVKG